MTKSFVAAEQKGPVLSNRSAQGAPELVSSKGRDGALIKEVPRVQFAVPQKLEDGTMNLVGPGLSDDADLPSGPLAVLGGIGVRQHVEFSDGVNP